MLLITPPTPDALEAKAIELFRARLADLLGVEAHVGTASHAPPAPAATETTNNLTVLLGTVADNPLLAPTLQRLSLASPAQPAGFVLYAGQADARLAGILPPQTALAVVAGADAHGVLYGLGRLLRKMATTAGGNQLAPCAEIQAPAIQDRGLYFATHFNNFYECAPLEQVRHYIEEMALWGFNLLTFWLDMNWFPHGFWQDPGSRGMQMVERLRVISKTARACGMQVGAVGVANEGFHFQPPPELRTNIAARRGAFYMDSQICPSQPGGLELILDNRRQVLELLGPLDLYVHWPYDSGGCGCALCSDAEHRWGKTFLRIGPAIASLVAEYHPQARFIISTWYCDEIERRMVYDLCDQHADWFDGIMLETKHATEPPIPTQYARLVFPEISMFDCFFISYGCNGANPAPQRFVQQARQMAAAGCGTTLYSEGMYEDINKVVWASVLWEPQRSAQAIVEEYSGYYFGVANQHKATDLILNLETTWGAKRLAEAAPETVRNLFQLAESLQAGLPAPRWCYARWRALRDRAEMDALMAQIGAEKQWLRSTRLLLEEAVYTEEIPQLRRKVQEFCVQIDQRQRLIDRLFDVHWHYLQQFSTERTILLFTPDALLGKTDFQRIADALTLALKIPTDEPMRQAVIKAIKRALWFNGIDLQYLFG
jgi:hypothetical protein